MSYTKLFSHIVTSSIWSEDDQTRILWITMLALSDKHGEVMASIPGLAKVAGLTIEATQRGIEKFLSPDPFSRTPDEEGRRLEVIDGGWAIINYAKHRRMASLEDRREKGAERQRRLRERRKANGNAESRKVTHKSRTRNGGVTPSDDIAEADTEAEANTTTSPKDAVVEAWNELGKPFPKVLNVSPDRARELSARLKDKWWTENYREALDFIRNSKFCRGEVPGKEGKPPWIADFDWFIRPGSVAKALEGKYKNQKEKACSV